MDETYIRARDLSRVYQSGTDELVVFSGLNLDVQRGEMLALVGESGAGKSTLLHMLGGLDRPSSGTIYYGSKEVSGLARPEQADFRNREIGFVWQIHYLLPEFTALENVCMPLLIRGEAIGVAKTRAIQLLERVGLKQRLDHKPGELSGGERQRCAVARALVTRPACVLADEPTGNLDEKNAAQVYALMLELNREIGTSLVLVTHDHGLAAKMDRVLELHDGALQDASR